jgi:peptide/nickel transport system substrate-binding protein
MLKHRAVLLLVFAMFVSACVSQTDEVTGEDTTATTGEGTSIAGEQTSTTVEQQTGQAPDRRADDSTIVVGWTGDINSLDPPESLNIFNRESVLSLYDQLLYYDYEEREDGTLVWQGLNVAPGLATDWDTDGNSVTFHLRDDVTFNATGNPLTAEDVKYTWERAFEVPGFGRFNGNLAGMFEPSRQITVIDDHTVRFDFETQEGEELLLIESASLPAMRFPQFGIVDSVGVQSHATDDDPWAHEWVKENSAGSGPYTVSSRTPGTEFVLEAVDDHWSGYPFFERVIFRILSGPADVTSLMLRGEIDLTSQLGARELRSLESAGFKILNAPIPDIHRLAFAVDVPPLDNKLVRQALAHAIPYQQIVETAFVAGERATSYVNPASPGFIPAWDRYATDPDRARELLEEAGFPDGFAVDIFYDTGVTQHEDIALIIKSGLAETGIAVTLRPMPTTEYAEQTTARVSGEDVLQGLLIQRGVIWLDDPNPTTSLLLACGGFANATRYCNEEVDQLHFENRFNPDIEARSAAYEMIQEIVAEDVPLIPLAVAGLPVAIHPDITGMAFTADPHLRPYLLRKAND